MTTVSSCRMIEAEMYGMMPEREDRQPSQVAAREQVDHAEQRALHLVEELGQRVAVDARRRHVGADPVGEEQDERS